MTKETEPIRDIQTLIKEYEQEECDFSNQEVNRKHLWLYVNRMEDSHLKCVLYSYLKGEEL